MNKITKFPSLKVNENVVETVSTILTLVQRGQLQILPHRGMGRIIDVPSLGPNDLIGGPGKIQGKREYGSVMADAKVKTYALKKGANRAFNTAECAHATGLTKAEVYNAVCALRKRHVLKKSEAGKNGIYQLEPNVKG